ncbi:MAG: hypothetical protein Q9210_002722 [Variospora velana]
MSNLFPSSQGPASQGPASHSHSSFIFAPPAGTQLSPPPTEGTPSHALGNTTVSNAPPYNNTPGPTLPPLQHRGDSHSFLSSPQHGLTPQQPRSTFHYNTESHPPPPVANSASDLSRTHEPFHAFDPAQKPEVRTHKSPPKRPAAADSPDGKAPSSNGRKRARTKVVAWDPKDLEDIYVRKEINKEDWDSIGKKLRDKKLRQAASNDPSIKRRSTFSNSPQAPSNGIKWATVNGSSPANADTYHRRESFEDDGSQASEEYELSSAPDSEHEGKPNRAFDHPARSIPQQAQALPNTELPTDYSNAPSMPVIIQEAPQKTAQAPSNFDVLAAQSRGKAIAPRQPLAATLTSIETLDDRQPQPHPHTSSLPPPSAPLQEPRAMQRAKRGREIEATGTLAARSASDFSKRRKHPTEAMGVPGTSNQFGEGYVVPFNPAAAHPMLPVPPRVPQESDLDSWCMQFRDAFRTLKASTEEDKRVQREISEAAISRANARAVQAQQNADNISEHYSEKMKELLKLKDLHMATQLEFEHRDQQYDAIQAENQKLREEVAMARDEKAQLLDEKAQLLEERARMEARMAVLEEERESMSRKLLEPSEPHTSTDMSKEDAQHEIDAAKRNAEQADAAIDLLNKEISSLRADTAGLRADKAEAGKKSQEMAAAYDNLKAAHNNLTETLVEFWSQDMESKKPKEMDRQILGLKEANQQLTNKFQEAEGPFEKLEYLNAPKTHTTANTLSNGTTAS